MDAPWLGAHYMESGEGCQQSSLTILTPARQATPPSTETLPVN
jgi:hypothetical protein